MQVAHFIQRYPPALGGSEAYFARLSRYLVAAGEQVSVATSSALDLDAFWSVRGRCLAAGTRMEDGVEVHRYPLWRWPGRRYPLKALSLVPHRLWQCLTLPCNPIAWGMWRDAGRTRPFDLVHATAFPYAWPIVCGLRLARRLRAPFLLTPFLHLGNPDDPADPTRRAYLSPALLSLTRAADRVFVQTDLERTTLLNQGIAADKLILLGMGVDVAECTGGDRQKILREWGVAEGEVVIGHLANNSQEKGSVDLLRAAERLRQSGRRFRLVLAGPEMPNFLSFWKSYGSRAGRVHRLGVLSEREKRDFYAGIDLFALPSRSDSFGMVLLEAWANGVPSVGYRAGGIAEVIRTGQDGVLVRCGDVQGLAESLGRLIDNQPLRQQLGATGKERVRREFQWQGKLDRVKEVYKEMTGGQRRRRPPAGAQSSVTY